MNRALGCRQPDPVKLASHPSAHAHHIVAAHLASAAPLPAFADKLPLMPRIDQGQSGSCTMCSSAIAIAMACQSLGIPLGFIPSQRVGYSITRAVERPDPSIKLEDNGADLEDVFVATGTYGVTPMEVQTTPDGRFCDVWTDDDVGMAGGGNVNHEPDLGELEVAGHVKVKLDVAPHTIYPTDPHVSDLMAAALSADPPLPVQAAGWVDPAFMRLGPNDVAQAPDPSTGGGGHAFFFRAYRTNAHGEREFLLTNSWGNSWGGDGEVWCSMAFVRSLWAMYVPDVKVVQS